MRTIALALGATLGAISAAHAQAPRISRGPPSVDRSAPRVSAQGPPRLIEEPPLARVPPSLQIQKAPPPAVPDLWRTHARQALYSAEATRNFARDRLKTIEETGGVPPSMVADARSRLAQARHLVTLRQRELRDAIETHPPGMVSAAKGVEDVVQGTIDVFVRPEDVILRLLLHQFGMVTDTRGTIRRIRDAYAEAWEEDPIRTGTRTALEAGLMASGVGAASKAVTGARIMKDTATVKGKSSPVRSDADSPRVKSRVAQRNIDTDADSLRLRGLRPVKDVQEVTTGSGNTGVHFEGELDGRTVIFKALREWWVPIDREEAVFRALERYGGPRVYGRVRVFDPNLKFFREAIAMEKIEGVDLRRLLAARARNEPLPFLITEKHIEAVQSLEKQLARDGQSLIEVNWGDIMLTPDPNRPLVPLDMIVVPERPYDIAHGLEFMGDTLLNTVQRLAFRRRRFD